MKIFLVLSTLMTVIVCLSQNQRTVNPALRINQSDSSLQMDPRGIIRGQIQDQLPGRAETDKVLLMQGKKEVRVPALAIEATRLMVEKDQDQSSEIQKPTFGPELARVAFLIGTFDADVLTYENPMSKGGAGKGHNTTRWTLDSLFMMMDYRDVGPNGTYEGHGMLTFDKSEKQYKCWWFDNYGGGALYKGNLFGDTLSLTAEIRLSTGPATMKVTWSPEGKKVRFRVHSDLGNGFVPLMETISTPSARTNKTRSGK